MSMDALVLSANKLLNLGLTVGCAEVVGRNSNYLGASHAYPAGVGAMAGIIQYSLHSCMEPAWTAVKLSLKLNPLGQAIFWIVQLVVEALMTSVLMQSVFKRGLSTQQATILTAESSICTAIVKFLADAARKGLA